MGTREIKVIGRGYELSATVDEEDYQTLKLSEYKFHRIIGRKTTYAATYKNGKQIYLHRLIMGLADGPKTDIVDHIDGNGLNNSRTNLRKTDNAGNARNTTKSLSGDFTSSYKGVYYNYAYNNEKPWQAHIKLPDGGKLKKLGCYRTEYEAAWSYNDAAEELFGPMANLNAL